MVVEDLSSKKKRSKSKHKPKKKKSKGSHSASESENAPEVTAELHSLSYYIDNQEELVNQMFEILHGEKLNAMLPPILKELSAKELKKLCVQELKKMAKDHVLCVINGEEYIEEKKEVDKLEVKQEMSRSSSPSELSYTPPLVQRAEPNELEMMRREGKNALELLELELRAKIIKTMLGRQPDDECVSPPREAQENEQRKSLENKIRAEILERLKQGKTLESLETPDYKGHSTDEQPQEVKVKQEPPVQSKEVPSKESEEPKKHKESDVAKKEKKSTDLMPPKERRPSVKEKPEEKVSSKEEANEREDKAKKGIEVDDNRSEEGSIKKRKLTRREFEERMRKARMNRSYRKRKSSEDEDDKSKRKVEKGKETDDADKEKGEGDPKKVVDENGEREEGEIDSNEEFEEGACSSTDSQASDYVAYRKSQKKKKGSYSGSSSLYSRSSSEYSTSGSSSRSRSRSIGKGHPCKNSKRTSGKNLGMEEKEVKPQDEKQKSAADKNGANSVRSPKKEEETWGHLCDIEFVESADEFDEALQKDKAENANKKPLLLPADGTDKIGISFSIGRKGVPVNAESDGAPYDPYSINNESEEEEDNKEKKAAKDVEEEEEAIVGNEGMEATEEIDIEIAAASSEEDSSTPSDSGDPPGAASLAEELDPTQKTEAALPSEQKELTGKIPLVSYPVSGQVTSNDDDDDDDDENEDEDAQNIGDGKKDGCMDMSPSYTPPPRLSTLPDEGVIMKDVTEQEQKGPTNDFYRGADDLYFSDEEVQVDQNDSGSPLQELVSEPVTELNSGIEELEEGRNGSSVMSPQRYKRSGNTDSSRFTGKLATSRDETPSQFESVEQLEKKETPAVSALVDVSQDSTSQDSKGDPYLEADNSRSFKEDDTEIIGTIETTQDIRTIDENDPEFSVCSWSSRWLQSEKVQKVMSSSKMLSRVRKKIQKKDKDTKTVVEKVTVATPKAGQTNITVIGSIEEYERLFGLQNKPPSSAPSVLPTAPSVSDPSKEPQQPSPHIQRPLRPPVVPVAEPVVMPEPAAALSDGDEDSEEEALWSSIMGT